MRTRVFRSLPRTVLLLGAVSLMNDIASEMVMPLLPVFLTTVLGAGPAALGLIEGVADATSAFLKLMSGVWSDRSGAGKRFVLSGYLISNLARPLIALAFTWPVVLVLRFVDRTGKGLRTAPRDAIIAGAVSAERRGSAFGFHRAMDHAGASVGPLFAAALLALGWTTRDVILTSFVPGALLMLLLVAGLPKVVSAGKASALSVSERLRPALRGDMRGVILATGAVSFSSVPDLLLIYWAHTSGVSDMMIPLLWTAAHLGRMVVTGFAGWVSDLFGRRTLTISGWTVRVLTLLFLATIPASNGFVWLGFLMYTAATAWTESVERAWISDLAPERLRASMLGAYHMATGIAALPGAVVLGIVWEVAGESAAFLFSAGLLCFATLFLGWSIHRKSNTRVSTGVEE
jgi:MFS family permease